MSTASTASSPELPPHGGGEAHGGMVKSLSLWNYFTMGFGAIIGTGWVLLVGDWMILGGGPVEAMIAFVLGAVFLLPIGAVFGELTCAIPISGGIVEYVDRTFGPTAAHITGWFLSLGNGILCPWEAIAISSLLATMWSRLDGFGWLTGVKLYDIAGSSVYLWPLLISEAVCVLVIALNFRGASAAAKLSSFLSKALLAGMVLAMVVSLFKGGPGNLMPLFAKVEAAQSGSASGAVTTAGAFLPGVLAVLVMTPFFYTGFDTIPQSAEEASEGLDWKKFGMVISASLLAAGLFYVFCIYAFGTIFPWRQSVAMPVPALASIEKISMWFYLPMLVIGTLGPLGPMNSFYGATARIMLAMGRKGYLPKSFASIDGRTGTPKTANIVLAVATVIGPFPRRQPAHPADRGLVAVVRVRVHDGRGRLHEDAVERARSAAPVHGARGKDRHRPGHRGRRGHHRAAGAAVLAGRAQADLVGDRRGVGRAGAGAAPDGPPRETGVSGAGAGATSPSGCAGRRRRRTRP